MRPTRSTDVRKAAINASTVFAITLAIIAGLICAWVFKSVFMKPQAKTVAAAPETHRVTVLAANVPEETKIASLQVKRITVPQKQWDEMQAKVKDRGEMLTGNQPIGRVTKVPLLAEEPVYSNDVKALHYPDPLKLEPGKVAAIVEVPASSTMVRKDDRVDLLCTLSNTDPDLGPTETRTAVMARNVKVLARFNTTADGARPSRSMTRTGTRPYTLEVSPFRYGLVELAKQIGGAFALRVHSKDETGAAAVVAGDGTDLKDNDNAERVTTDDLVKLFGFSRPLPPKYFEIEKYSGVDQVKDAHVFLQPGSPAPKESSNQQRRPGSSTGGLQGPNMRSGGGSGSAPGGGGSGRPSQAPAGGGGAPGRQASNNATSQNATFSLPEAGWRRLNSDGGNSGGPGGGMALASNRRPSGVGGGTGAGSGGLGGPSSASAFQGSTLGGMPRDCPNCGKKK